MYVASTSTSNDDDAATRWWAPCSPLDDIADSDAAGMLPTIYSTRAGGGGGGVGGCGRIMLLRLKKRWGHWGCDGRTIFFVWWLVPIFFVWWLVRQWKSIVTIWYKYAIRLIWGRWTRTRRVGMGELLVLLVCWKSGPYGVPDQQGDIQYFLPQETETGDYYCRITTWFVTKLGHNIIWCWRLFLGLESL